MRAMYTLSEAKACQLQYGQEEEEANANIYAGSTWEAIAFIEYLADLRLLKYLQHILVKIQLSEYLLYRATNNS